MCFYYIIIIGKKDGICQNFSPVSLMSCGRIWNEVRILYQSRIGNPHGKGEYV